MKRSRYLAPLLGLLLTLGAPVAAEAATNFNLTTSPLPVSLVAKPGTTVSTPIKVANTGNQAVKINVSLMKFSAFGDQGKPQIQTPSPNDESIKWVSFSQKSFIAQPGVFNTITMTIKVPKTAAFGYYYAVVFSEDNTATAGSRQTAVNGAVATLVLLDAHVAGEKRQLSVANFTVTKKVYEYLPAEFTVTVKNTGNIHVVPSGNIFISKGGNDNLAALDINSAQGNVLPGSSRQFTVDWSDGFPHYQPKKVNGQVVSDKNGKPENQLSWDFSKIGRLRIGHYKATLDLVYNDGSRDIPVEGEVSFWVIPWRLLLGGLVVLVLILLGLSVPLRSLVRRIKKWRRK